MRIAAAALAAVLVAGATAGCAGGSVTPGAGAGETSTPTAQSPAPKRTIIRDSRVVAAGRVVPFAAQRGVTLRLRASKPDVSRTSLSSTYGYPPSHGYYVTFRMTLVNTGRKPVQLGPANFVVAVRGQGRVTSYDGNGPYSGAHAQLDTTEITPGEVLHAPLSFDVGKPHGRLQFVPDSSAAIVWRF